MKKRYIVNGIMICIVILLVYLQNGRKEKVMNTVINQYAYSARTAHPFQRNGAPFRFKLSKAQQVD